ncbi:hypothetical protein C7271_24255 [filamentous cyanobacterium CCP5]|nr:hypothetical protein C7271_24255 [filamentous cyanobacterium CCP5]
MAAKILVVDDDPDFELLIRQKFRRQIQQQELSFVFAHDGLQALEKLEIDPEIEVVLADINMPDMDGLSLLSQIRQTYPLIKAVIVSAYGDMDNIRQAMNRGAFDFLCKPINFQELEIATYRTLDYVHRLKTELGSEREALRTQTEVVSSLRQQIAERQQAESALRRSEATNRALIQGMPDMVIRAREDGTYLAIAGRERFTVYDGDHFSVGTTLHDSLPPEQAQLRMYYIQQALATGQLQLYEHQLIVDGQLRHEEVRIVVIGEGEVMIVVRDITERKQAEQALRVAEEKYRGIFENALEGIFQTSLEGRYLSVNPAMARIFGYGSAAEMMVQVTDIQTQIYVDHRLRQEFQRQMQAQGVVREFEYQACKADGSIIWVQESSHAVYNEDGEMLYYEGILLDVTQRHQAEAERQRFVDTLARKNRDLEQVRDELAIANATLEQRVAERTEELSQTLNQLQATQEQIIAQEKLASLGALTAGIAHEIKNPLNFVNNFAELIEEMAEELQEELKPCQDRLEADTWDYIHELCEDLSQNARKVLKHGQRADGIVRSMLMHSRGGKGEHQTVNVNSLLSEALNLAYHGMRAQNRGFNITLETHLAPDLPETTLFSTDFNRALLNLINNSFYATHEKVQRGIAGYEPLLVASTRQVDNYIEIRLRDNGPGIPPAVRAKMFEPFFSTKPTGQGTGLGLSICHDIIVQAHHGTISVETEPGEFTEFVIMLPVNVLPEETP